MVDPRRERSPDVYGHVINVPTHPNDKLPAIGGHLLKADADSHLLVVRTCYNGQFKHMPRFVGHFNTKSVALRTLSCDQHFAHINMRPSGDRKQCFISQTLVTFALRHHVVCVKPAMSEKIPILSFDQCASCRARAIEMVRQNANSTHRSKHSGQKEPSWSSGIDLKDVDRQMLTYVDYKCSRTVPQL